MEINNTASAIAQQSSTTSESSSSDTDKDMFLQLLVTQLQYQDPLEPVDNTEFIAQTAQFSLLEEMQSMSEEFSQNKAFQMIGKYVTASVQNPITNSMESISGYVEGVSINDGETTLDMGDYSIDPDNVIGVRNEE
jgi:flagellar basal-body rod modification protein FlgD